MKNIFTIFLILLVSLLVGCSQESEFKENQSNSDTISKEVKKFEDISSKTNISGKKHDIDSSSKICSIEGTKWIYPLNNCESYTCGEMYGGCEDITSGGCVCGKGSCLYEDKCIVISEFDKNASFQISIILEDKIIFEDFWNSLGKPDKYEIISKSDFMNLINLYFENFNKNDIDLLENELNERKEVVYLEIDYYND
jgi:hypothetical protein